MSGLRSSPVLELSEGLFALEKFTGGNEAALGRTMSGTAAWVNVRYSRWSGSKKLNVNGGSSLMSMVCGTAVSEKVRVPAGLFAHYRKELDEFAVPDVLGQTELFAEDLR